MTQAFNLSQLANFTNSSGQLDASAGLYNETAVVNGGTGAGTAADAKVSLEVITAVTGSEVLPVGTTAQRDASPQAGYIRFNSDTGQFEGYNGTIWTAVGGGNATNTGLWENSQDITSDYTITSGNNAMSAGPITIDAGVEVTVPTGSRWIVL